jgi:hypothetical protein
MEEKLLKLLKLADKLNDTQDKVYAEIKYTANDNKTLEICIRTKVGYTYVEKCEIQLKNKSIIGWDNIISLFETFVGGVSNE